MTRSAFTEGDRRTVLKFLGTLSTIGITGLAGCTGEGGENGADTLPGSDYPAVEEWLTETKVGDADDTYEGAVLDLREESDVTIDVGAPGNGDGFAFGPSAVAVSTGTEVLWDWTGEGGQHNVEAEPDAQIGESDYEFSSGEPVLGSANEYSTTFDEPGIALYHCEPHLSVGMKGAIVVD